MSTTIDCPMASRYGLDCQYTRQVKPRNTPLTSADAMDEANFANLMAERVHTTGKQHEKQVAFRSYWLAMHAYYVNREANRGK